MQVIKCDVCSEWRHRKCEHILDIVSNPNANWEYHKCKEISSIIMTVVLFKKVLIGKRSIVIAKFPQEAKVIGEDVK